MATNNKSTGEGLIIIAIMVAIALFRGCQKEQEREEQTAAWKREQREQAENKWLQKEAERRRIEATHKRMEEEREKQRAQWMKWDEERKRQRQVYDDELIRQKAREGEAFRPNYDRLR